MKDWCVLVTGGAAGVGRGLALEAARRGARVFIGDINDATETVSLIKSEGGSADSAIADVLDISSLKELVRRAQDRFGAVNVVVNNVGGGGASGRLWEANPEDVQRTFNVMILGTFNTIHVTGPVLIETAAAGGPAYLMNVGSEHSLGVPPHLPPLSSYTVSKYTSLGFTDTARRDFEGTGVNVSMLAPTWVLTESISKLLESSEQMRTMVGPYGQSPAEVAAKAFDGLLAGAYIIPTHPVIRGFALDHARDVMAAVQVLPIVDDDEHLHDGSGDASKCPVMPGMFD